MLSLGKMEPDQAVDYFTQDNYYQQKDSIESSEWWGDGADEFGLSGPVADMEIFRNLCDGFDPIGKTQLRQASKNGKPVAGIDATFSAPKSLSLAALVGGDNRLIVAHKAAVKVALEIMRDRYLKTRLNRQHVQAYKPVVALFDHDTSRELDPQLHTHCFWMNLCQTRDGKWQSLSNENFYEFKMLLGQVYRNELARLCQELGYKIEHRSDGLFELAGYSREQVLKFSERHNQIMDTLKEMGLPDTTANRIFALFKTRKTKEKDIDRTALKAYWVRTAQTAGIKHPTPGEAIQEAVDLNTIVDQALRHCEERRSVFPIEAMERFITESPTGHKMRDIEKAIATHPKTIHKEQHLATEWSLEREKLTLALMQSGKGTQTPIGGYVQDDELSPDQLAALNLALASRDRVLGWVGVAGAGKTNTVSALLAAIGESVSITGLAPDASAAQTLEQEIGIRANTVASFLLSEPSSGRRLIVVDEAGKLSAREAYELLQKSKSENLQLVLIGDPKQLSAVEAGNPFKALIENGMASARLGDFFRQKDPTLNLAVQMIYHDWGVESLQLLNSRGWVNEYSEFAQRMQAIAEQWAASEGDVRILAGTHIEREALTTLLRNHLREKGKIAQTEFQSKTLKSKDLTVEQAQHIRFYDVGDILIPGQHQHGLRASKQYRVASIEGDRLYLESGSLKTTVDLATLQKPLNVRVYQEDAIGVSVGDRLRWTQNNRRLGRVNGQEFTVMGFEDGAIRIRYDNGKRDQVGLNQLNHIDHGLVRTIYSSQGMTCDEVLIAIGNDQTVTKESILVAMSRARLKAHFFCADKGLLFERVEQSGSQVNISEWLKVKGFKLKAPEPPSHIDLAHWVERVEQSGILPSVAELNVQSIEGDAIYQRLLETRLEKMGSGQTWTVPMQRLRDYYEQVAEGGAWNLGGIDACCLPTLKPGDHPAYKGWGELKPDHPRTDVEKTLKKGSPQVRKYEAPLDEAKGIFFPDVPDALADKIYERYGVNPSTEQRESGFWACVYWHPQIEIHITEGKKKAEADISQGYACIALPSVTGGYRSNDENGDRLPQRVLHDELAVFAVPGRPIKMTFDQDKKRETIENVRRELVRTGELLQGTGCDVKVVKWKGEKGCDDFIVQNGAQDWTKRLDLATPLQWTAQQHYASEYRKMSVWVQKQNGKAPDQRKLDVALAIVCQRDSQDAAKLLVHSPAIKNASADEAKAYLTEVCREAVKVKEKIEAPKVEEQKPTVRMRI
jgi:conjugative relaxase-like TrwC/TraI family protein